MNILGRFIEKQHAKIKVGLKFKISSTLVNHVTFNYLFIQKKKKLFFF